MTQEQVAMVVGVILSLAFSYVPGLNSWYGGLTSAKKQLIMLGLLLVVPIGALGLVCLGVGSFLGLTFTCDPAGLVDAIMIFISAAIANQAAYKLSPEAGAVTEAKEERA